MSTARIDELRAKFDENPRRYFAPLANEYRKAGDLSQAIALCREHLPKQPGHMSGHIVFGQALFESGELSEAQTVFQAALDLDPENLIALRHLGDIARSRGDDPLARRWYERVLDADPRNDDIAALLSTLTARLTPQSVTPVSAPAVRNDAPTLDLDAMSDADDTNDPFSSPDSPAWHTPSFLTPLASTATAQGASDAPDTISEPELSGAFAAAEGYSGLDTSQADDGATAQQAALDDQVSPDSDDLLDLDFSVDARDAHGDHEVHELHEVHEIHETDEANEVHEAHETHGAFDVRNADDARAAVNADDLRNAIDVIDVSDVQTSEPVDALAVALGAFASHDLEDAATDSSFDEHHDHATLQADQATPFSDDADAFEEGLVAQEWPDTTALTTRTPTPVSTAAHAELPIVPDSTDDALAGAGELSHGDASHDVASHDNASHDYASHDVASHDHASHDYASHDDTSHDELLHAGLETEPAATAEIEAVAEVVADDITASGFDQGVLVSLDDTVSVHAHVEHGSESVEEAAHDVVEVAAEVAAESDVEDVVTSVADDTPDAADHADQSVSVDEDPPASTVDIPWLSAPEAEREAEVFIESAQGDSLEVSHDDAYGEPAYDDDPSHDDEQPSAEPTAAPAFVTETMAELLVAQGFVARAADVYEELIARRPYDAVLTFRLQELRAMLAEEQSASAQSQSFTPVADGTPASGSPASGTSASGTPSSGTPAHGTPVRSATPVRPGTPVRTHTPVADLAAVPFTAPPARRSARELFAALASMRVARRTPAYGSATVAMPTPADGLASLFGESPIPADDLTARAMARAFGSGEGVEAGPSMFTPAPDAEQPRNRPTPSAVPPVLSGPAFSFDRFFPDPATASGSSAGSASASDSGGSSQAPETAVASESGEAPAAGPSSAGADLAQFSHWLKGLSNS